MSKFVFVEKQNELPWWIDCNWTAIPISRLDDNDKYKMRKWIESMCTDEVIVFGKTRWPKVGERDYAGIMTGDGSFDVYFENPKEAALFKLTWFVS